MTTLEISARERASRSIAQIEQRFHDVTEINSQLTRSLVSFQANRTEPIFRWFKYREGFSRSLVDYLLDELFAKPGQTIFDPFAGTGASLFTAAERGLNGIGVELLPVGSFFMSTRDLINRTDPKLILKWITDYLTKNPWLETQPTWQYPHLRITGGAFPAETEECMSRYKTWLGSLHSKQGQFFDFVLFSVLEEISFTRKDGQYLRWDSRSSRSRSKTSFSKGEIIPFCEAINNKLRKIEADIHQEMVSETLTLFTEDSSQSSKLGSVTVLQGSVFNRIADVANNSVNLVITSPPYCNRYDYTRTYALELAYLGVDEIGVKDLRQSLLTCTVEHRPKSFESFDTRAVNRSRKALADCQALTDFLEFLQFEADAGSLNNKGIVNMVHGYFLDSALHLAQMVPKMRRGGSYVMVNDNVQYNGLGLPVDCILSSIAESLGLRCKKIWVLPQGKGNSSQQMKLHGRQVLRKCVYIWQKP